MKSIFLSHSHKDKPFVKNLNFRLEANGIKTWFDEAKIKVGDSLISNIEPAIAECDYLGIILSPNSVKSNWVKKELHIALSQEISEIKTKVLPILYKNCNIPDFLNDKVYADFRVSFENGLNKLLHRLLDLDKKPEYNTDELIKNKLINKMYLIKNSKRLSIYSDISAHQIINKICMDSIDGKVINPIINSIDHDNIKIKRFAVIALGELKSSYNYFTDTNTKHITDRLISLIRKCNDVGLAWRIIWTLGAIKYSDKGVERLLSKFVANRSKQTTIRWRAAWAMGELGLNSALLASHATDKNENIYVRLACIRALVNFSDIETEWVFNKIKQDEVDIKLIIAANKILEQIKTRK